MSRPSAVMTTSEAAGYLRISEKTLRRLTAENKIPHFKAGRQNRYHRVILQSLRTNTPAAAG